jgi:hypothetical protein
VRIYSEGDSNVTSGAAVAVIQTKEIAIVNVTRVIATVHISVCHCFVERKSRITARGSVSFYRSMAKAEAEVFYGLFYGRAKF